jgi:hypothetical protein
MHMHADVQTMSGTAATGGDHGNALLALLWLPVVAAVALGLLRLAWPAGFRRVAAARGTVHLAVLAILGTSIVHLALVPEHLGEAPVLGVLFALSVGAGVVVCAAAYAGVRHWHAAAGLLLVGLLAAYAGTRLAGYEDWDGVGLTTKAVELLALAAVVADARRERLAAILSRTGSLRRRRYHPGHG